MYFHRPRSDFSFVSVLTLALASVVLAAAVRAASSVTIGTQHPNSVSSTSHAATVTQVSVQYPAGCGLSKRKQFWSRTTKSVATGDAESAIRNFMHQIIKYQFELGDLGKKDFKFPDSAIPSESDNGWYKFEVTLFLDHPKQNWQGRGAVGYTNRFVGKKKISGTLYDAEGYRIAAITDNEFEMDLYMRGRPMDTNIIPAGSASKG
ncbi:hypothetical protein J3R30DRAFT_1456611 [Lentinula aciculospora]|uniref:Uncharacterized protein n=1 Tax=Lentinula aciculospora TaxID=153920 RepID=A0A9W9AM04_9AGAR|nr:hypothetical protein J3R30DRAFT_1456611 [Lentinula aciculospora]